MYETKDALLRYLPEQYRSAIRFVESRAHPHRAAEPHHRLHPEPDLRVVAAPGTFGISTRRATPRAAPCARWPRPDPGTSEFREPAPRLALMDEQGIEKALMYPTLANLVEQRIENDPSWWGR